MSSRSPKPKPKSLKKPGVKSAKPKGARVHESHQKRQETKESSSKKSVRFVKSAVQVNEFPEKVLPWIAFVGRSNAGKSSTLNALAGQKGLAKVSQVPGKTRLLNFFQLGERAYWVDMPGYGFARTSQSESQSWQKMIEDFFQAWGWGQVEESSKRHGGVVWIFDIRRKIQEEERLLVDYLQYYDIPFCFALNKADKLNQKERAQAARYFKEVLGSHGIDYFYISAIEKKGLDEVWNWMEEICR